MTTLPRYKIHQAYSRYHSSLKRLEQEYHGTAMSLSDYGYGKKRIEVDLQAELKILGPLPLTKISQAYGRYFSDTEEARKTYTRTGQYIGEYHRALKCADEALSQALSEIEESL
jgi:hypothetical protein